ncbi:MAG: bifunctional 3-deoxy-7-phosphoheptulonate synthase/chorismate mutase [Bacteroidia bacterium]
MILHLSADLSSEKVQLVADLTQSIVIKQTNQYVLVTPSKLKEVPAAAQEYVQESFYMPNDMQLASRKYLPTTREVSIDGINIGGNLGKTMVITGPCSVESEEQIEQVAQYLVKLGVKVLRAGAFKPRTSPYSFQGLGLDGLKLLAKMREKYGLKIITEVKDATHVEAVIEYADIVQIGAKAMYDHGILRRCGKTDKAILLKRGFGTTTQEFVQAAEFILSGGNEKVMLCERGIRTFEFNTRFTLDLCGAAYLKEHTNLPIFLDPSHAMGYAYGVPDLSRACMAMGVEGLLIETHPNPSIAKSDASQQLDFAQFETMYSSLKAIANAIGREVV